MAMAMVMVIGSTQSMKTFKKNKYYSLSFKPGQFYEKNIFILITSLTQPSPINRSSTFTQNGLSPTPSNST